MDRRRQNGKNGETVAASFLQKQGVHILKKNFHCKVSEIDLIGKEQETILVVEVKMRNDKKQGYPCEAVDRRKQHKICRTFDYFRMKNQLDDFVPVRFDVVEVDGDDRCHWIQNAFEYEDMI